tara:strand:- start:13 stop:306 length:294 start_codon:yes stop_codon:yes gene_type:complete
MRSKGKREILHDKEDDLKDSAANTNHNNIQHQNTVAEHEREEIPKCLRVTLKDMCRAGEACISMHDAGLKAATGYGFAGYTSPWFAAGCFWPIPPAL